MISIEEALQIVVNQKVNCTNSRVALSGALSRYLAQDIRAPLSLPPFDNAAMDGYAVSGKYQQYRLSGEIRAGGASEISLQDGEACRIFTGAAVPDGATAVVMQEYTQRNGQMITVKNQPVAGQHIRLKGEQIKAGAPIFEKGRKLNEASLGLISSMGISELEVYDTPSLGLLVTGDEVVAPGQSLKYGQIYESNSVSLGSALKRSGFTVTRYLKAKDNLEDTVTQLEKMLEDHHVVLVSGGISVGDHDYVKTALDQLGVDTLFYKVRQKPGKPLFFGRRQDTFVFALPGNPASSLTCLYVYVLPLLQKLSGARENLGLHKLRLPLTEDYELTSDRPSFLKAKTHADGVTILGGQASSMLKSMAEGNALVYLSEKGTYPAGTHVKCYLLP